MTTASGRLPRAIGAPATELESGRIAEVSHLRGTMTFDGFSAAERAFLAGQRLGRLATVSPRGVGNAPVDLLRPQ